MNKLYEFLKPHMESKTFSSDELYQAGIINVKDNIEFYVDKTYTCESVIQELFIRGVTNYIERKRGTKNPS
jgi:hypothetical protein